MTSSHMQKLSFNELGTLATESMPSVETEDVIFRKRVEPLKVGTSQF